MLNKGDTFHIIYKLLQNLLIAKVVFPDQIRQQK
jgi:hypothetical protein